MENPAEHVLIYAYHTNAEGVYPRKGDETGNGQRHGYLRGWVRTNAQGQYRFTTIRPARYPSRTEPAHVHLTLTTETMPEYWVYATKFEGDSLLEEDAKGETDPVRRGQYPHAIMLRQDEAGVWQGERNIVLPK